jgi:cellulose synthase (UDP-forming)
VFRQRRDHFDKLIRQHRLVQKIRAAGADSVELALGIGLGRQVDHLSLRYFFWRTFTTIGLRDPISFIAAIALYLAEIYGMSVYFLGVFVNIRPLWRQPVALPQDSRLLPSVDILVPSYNEDPEMLEITLLAALQVRYPKHKLQVYLLDDGGTVNKRNNPDPIKSAAAWQRHRQLQAL